MPPHWPCSSSPNLFPAKKADAAGKGSAVVYAVGEKVRRVDVIVDIDPVLAGRHVVESTTDGPVITERVESLFDVRVQREPRGETARTGGLHDLLLIVDDVERESSADLG